MGLQTAEPVLAVGAELGEGPVWDERRQSLLFVDIMGRRVHWFNPETGRHDSFTTEASPGTVGLCEDGGLVIALHDRFTVCGPGGEDQAPLGDFRADGELVTFNDGKPDPWGRFVAGTKHIEESGPHGSLYMLSPDNSVVSLLDEVTISNGLAWSADRRTFYYVDTPTHLVEAFDVEPASGALSRRRTVAEVPDGYPDGMAIDDEGCLWVAIWDGERVDRYAPSGERLTSIGVPEGGHVSSVAFGGPDLSTLYVTTARVGMSGDDLAAAPHAGDIFAFEALVSGPAANRFDGGRAATLRRAFGPPIVDC